jgi:EAL domain-containing protein (putative c-di-GMP-specific phosphodiesterase class I)
VPADTAPLRPRTVGIDWDTALAVVFAEPGRVRPAFQPIFDLRNGVVAGFEMLARFDAPANASPPEWFAAAEARGLGARLEALLLAAGLRAREVLPTSCFLSVNLSPAALLSREVEAVLHRRSLEGVVVELTGTAPVQDYTALEGVLDRLREAGAEVAVDDTGGSYDSLRHVIRLRPSFVKLDRELVSDIDTDPAKLALVEAMGALAGRLDASVVASGVERTREREVLAELGVPLAQGFGLARPARELQAGLRLPATAPRGEGVIALVERAGPVLSAAEAERAIGGAAGTEPAAVLDDDGRPVGLLVPDAAGSWRLNPQPLTVAPAEPPAQAARRAMSRPAPERFDPLACCDESGRYLGLVTVEQLVRALADAE